MTPRPSGRRRSIGLTVAVTDRDGRATRAPGLARWLERIAPPRARGTVAIALISDRRMRTLNRAFRGIDRATDVLSFPANDAGAGTRRLTAQGIGLRGRPSPEPRALSPKPVLSSHLGDLAIARGVASRQARDHRHSLGIELKILALHGLLHLLGYDHERDRGAMQRIEDRLRRRAGLPAGLIARAPRQTISK